MPSRVSTAKPCRQALSDWIVAGSGLALASISSALARSVFAAARSASASVRPAGAGAGGGLARNGPMVASASWIAASASSRTPVRVSTSAVTCACSASPLGGLAPVSRLFRNDSRCWRLSKSLLAVGGAVDAGPVEVTGVDVGEHRVDAAVTQPVADVGAQRPGGLADVDLRVPGVLGGRYLGDLGLPQRRLPRRRLASEDRKLGHDRRRDHRGENSSPRLCPETHGSSRLPCWRNSGKPIDRFLYAWPRERRLATFAMDGPGKRNLRWMRGPAVSRMGAGVDTGAWIRSRRYGGRPDGRRRPPAGRRSG